MCSKKTVIEIAAAAAPFVVGQFADKKFIIPVAAASAIGVYAYNKWAVPGYAPFSGEFKKPAAILLALFGGGTALAYWKPEYSLLIGAATLAAIYLNEKQFYGDI